MVVDDFHFVTISIAPDKTDSPLVVDPNRMLSVAIASQNFQLISGRRCQYMQLRRCMKLEQFANCDTLNGPKTLGVLIVKKLLGFL
jgi:hypothetical protein